MTNHQIENWKISVKLKWVLQIFDTFRRPHNDGEIVAFKFPFNLLLLVEGILSRKWKHAHTQKYTDFHRHQEERASTSGQFHKARHFFIYK